MVRFRAFVRSIGALELAVLCISVVAVVWPVMTADWLPFVDYPQHLATIAALQGGDDPTWSRHFVADYGRTQYLLFYFLGAIFGPWLGVDLAGRLAVVLALGGLPLAVASFLAAHQRPWMLGAASAAVAVHVFVFWGFLSYALGMAVAVASLAALARLVRRPAVGAAVLFGAGAVATFYAHAQAYAWLAVACVVQVVALGPSLGWRRVWRGTWRGAVASLPSVGAMALWIVSSGVLERGMAGDRSGHAAEVSASDAPPEFAPVAETVGQWLQHGFGFYRDGGGTRIAIGFFAVLALLIVLRGHPRGDPSHRQRGFDTQSSAPEWVWLATVAAYLFAPVSYRYIDPISHRFLPLALALAPVLGPRVLVPGRWRGLVAAALVGLALYTAVVHTRHFERADAEMGELAKVLDQAEPGRRLLGLIYDRGSRVVPLPIYLHAHQYYQAHVGGMAAFSFAEFPISPLRYREGSSPPPFPPRFEWTPRRYDPDRWGSFFDYLLIRKAPGRPVPLRAERMAPGGAERLAATSRWALYRLRHRPSAALGEQPPLRRPARIDP